MSAWLDDRAAAKRAARPWAAEVNTSRTLDAAVTAGVTDAVAEAEDRAYAEWLPLLARPRVPGYVSAAIPERFRARYEREGTATS